MDYYVHLCWDKNHHMEKNIRERDKDIKLFYLEIDRLILYEKGVVFTPGVANAVGMAKHTIQEAVAGEMIDSRCDQPKNWVPAGFEQPSATSKS